MKCCKKMGLYVLVAIAFVVAVLAAVDPHRFMMFISTTTRFFDVMLPILAAGALLKYLCCCPHSNKKS